MASASSSAVWKHLTTLFQRGTAAGLTDGSLLDRFRSGPAEDAEAAFAVLVERHGPMVVHICRRILGDRHDAEDAAQATFLVLARQARAIRRTDSVASWLYGVAARVATQARRDDARRRARERRGAEVAMMVRSVDDGVRDASEAWPELYEELGRLPDRFRLPIVLCHLQGLTYEQAARQLGCPVRTIQSRLDRARQRLRDRLTRRGVSPAVLAMAPDIVSTILSETWKQTTTQAAVRYAASGTLTAIVPATVAALAEGALRTMFFHRLLKWTAAVLVIGVAAGGAGMAMRAQPAPPEPRRHDSSQPAENSNRFRLTMDGGVTVEVVGISTVPTGPHTWWKPDGTSLDDAPVDTIEAKTHGREGEPVRVILLHTSGVKRNDLFRWLPTPITSYWGGRPRKNGQNVPELDYYEAAFPADRSDCGIALRLANGPWKTEVTNDGRGGVGTFSNGHKFTFGKARPYSSRGRSMTVFAVAHNFLEQDRRIVAIDREGHSHPAVSYSVGSDGDKKWLLDLIDAEFDLPPDQIQQYQIQFRPIALVEMRGIALHPQSTGKQEHRSITISRAYWADADDAPDSVKRARRQGFFVNDGSGQLLIHGDEWIEGQPWQQYKVFLLAAGKEFLFQADGHPDVHGRTTAGSIVGHTDHELMIAIPPDEFARMEPGVEYTLKPRNEVPGYEWKIKGRVTITKPR